MVFASLNTKNVPLGEGDKAVVATIAALSGKVLEEAAQARQVAQIATARAAGADLVKLFRELDDARAEARKKAGSRYDAFDRETVLAGGVKSISPLPKGMKLADAIADLEEPERELLHRTILDSSPVFREAPEADEKVGKDD